jgi:hypothetical protein
MNRASASALAPAPVPVPVTGGSRAWSGSEAVALVSTVAAVVSFGAFGLVTGAPSTVAYVCVVSALTGALVRLRRSPLPSPLVLALALAAVGHLAGGLVRVGDDVLYNASAGGQLLRYDHLVHSTATALGTITLWHLFERKEGPPLVVWLLAGLGLGGANETIEFVTTMVHHGSHVGGYVNTGWDLVANLAGAGAATIAISRQRTAS